MRVLTFIYKCDKCGHKDMDRINSMMISRVHKIGRDPEPSKNFDLCDNCYDRIVGMFPEIEMEDNNGICE